MNSQPAQHSDPLDAAMQVLSAIPGARVRQADAGLQGIRPRRDYDNDFVLEGLKLPQPKQGQTTLEVPEQVAAAFAKARKAVHPEYLQILVRHAGRVWVFDCGQLLDVTADAGEAEDLGTASFEEEDAEQEDCEGTLAHRNPSSAACRNPASAACRNPSPAQVADENWLAKREAYVERQMRTDRQERAQADEDIREWEDQRDRFVRSETSHLDNTPGVRATRKAVGALFEQTYPRPEGTKRKLLKRKEAELRERFEKMWPRGAHGYAALTEPEKRKLNRQLERRDAQWEREDRKDEDLQRNPASGIRVMPDGSELRLYRGEQPLGRVERGTRGWYAYNAAGQALGQFGQQDRAVSAVVTGHAVQDAPETLRATVNPAPAGKAKPARKQEIIMAKSATDLLIEQVVSEMTGGRTQALAARPKPDQDDGIVRDPKILSGFMCREGEKPVGFWTAAGSEIPVDPSWKKKNPDLYKKVVAFLEDGRSGACYKGCAPCRLCHKKENGCCDMRQDGFVYPEGYLHYITAHGVRPAGAVIEAARGIRIALKPVPKPRLPAPKPRPPAFKNNPAHAAEGVSVPHAPRSQAEAWQRLLEHARRYGLPESDCKQIAARFRIARAHKLNPAGPPPPPKSRAEAWYRLGEHARRYGLPQTDVSWFFAKARDFR